MTRWWLFLPVCILGVVIGDGLLYGLGRLFGPRLLNLPKMYSIKLIDTHFWLHTIGVVVYIATMWIAGVTQGLMWRATDPENGTLVYSFVEALNATKPYYLFRLVGGLIVLSGMLVMAWNVFKTFRLAAASTVAQVVLPPDLSDARA